MSYKINSKEDLEIFLINNLNEIHRKIDSMMLGLEIPFYSSVDIREGKFKFAPVDHNLYPAGFNNICNIDLNASITTLRETIASYGNSIKKIMIHPESHTKNTLYLENIWGLQNLLTNAGFEVKFASFDKELFGENKPVTLKTANNKDVTVHPATIANDLVLLEGAGDFVVDLIILNHDQSNPLNVDWKSIKVPIVPPYYMGWYNREKNKHFYYYKKVLEEFCDHYSINPDLMMAKFKAVEDLDFSSKEGLDRLAQAVDDLKGEITPNAKIFVKASKGTYGMGIMVVDSGADIVNINRKERNKMDVGKNKIKFTSILVQEGVETVLKYDEMPAEITMYLIGGKCVGGFMRANSERDANSNLNSKGMVFIKFCMSELKQGQDHKCRECTYSIIARLATLASCYEIKELKTKG